LINYRKIRVCKSQKIFGALLQHLELQQGTGMKSIEFGPAGRAVPQPYLDAGFGSAAGKRHCSVPH